MEQMDLELLHDLVNVHSLTGREQYMQRFIKGWTEPFADEIQVDDIGNLAIVVNPKAKIRVMLAGHCDRIGFMVMQYTPEGRIRVDPLGGIDEATVLGARVVIHTKQGDVPGVVGKVSTHLQAKADKDAVPTIDQIWIDIGAKDRDEAKSLVAVGDYVSYEPSLINLHKDRVSAPGLDNMLGVYTIMQVAKRCAEAQLDVALYCVSTVQEEIGARGAKVATSAINPHISIAVDTTLANDTPGKVKDMTTPDIKLGAGPSILHGPSSHPAISHLLIKAAKQDGIVYQLESNADIMSNDVKTMQLAHVGCASGSVGIPVRNMHTQAEIADLQDVERTVALLVKFVMDLKHDVDLSPINYDENGKKIASDAINRIGYNKDV